MHVCRLCGLTKQVMVKLKWCMYANPVWSGITFYFSFSSPRGLSATYCSNLQNYRIKLFWEQKLEFYFWFGTLVYIVFALKIFLGWKIWVMICFFSPPQGVDWSLPSCLDVFSISENTSLTSKVMNLIQRRAKKE